MHGVEALREPYKILQIRKRPGPPAPRQIGTIGWTADGRKRQPAIAQSDITGAIAGRHGKGARSRCNAGLNQAPVKSQASVADPLGAMIQVEGAGAGGVDGNANLLENI